MGNSSGARVRQSAVRCRRRSLDYSGYIRNAQALVADRPAPATAGPGPELFVGKGARPNPAQATLRFGGAPRGRLWPSSTSGASMLLGLVLAFAQVCNGSAELCARPYNKVTFAGTHDSYAASEYVPNVLCMVPLYCPISNPGFVAQEHGITRQLNDGIRAFDLRLVPDSGGGYSLCRARDERCQLQAEFIKAFLKSPKVALDKASMAFSRWTRSSTSPTTCPWRPPRRRRSRSTPPRSSSTSTIATSGTSRRRPASCPRAARCRAPAALRVAK